jgi:hypothetical protein
MAAALVLGAIGGPAGSAAGAVRLPDVVVDAGHTLAVQDGPGRGGATFGLSLLWRLEDHFRVGAMAFADGLGERTTRLIGEGGVDLGPVAGPYRTARGVGVRLEAHLPGAHALEPHLAATWGFYRVEDNVRGSRVGHDDAAGFGLGVGLLRALNPHHAAGIAVRAQQLSRGQARPYLGAALEWRWGLGAGD